MLTKEQILKLLQLAMTLMTEKGGRGRDHPVRCQVREELHQLAMRGDGYRRDRVERVVVKIIIRDHLHHRRHHRRHYQA